MVKQLSKEYPQAFQVLLKYTNPFDPLWNDWKLLSFLINAGFELTLSKTYYTAKFKENTIQSKITSHPLDQLVNDCFRIMENYITNSL